MLFSTYRRHVIEPDTPRAVSVRLSSEVLSAVDRVARGAGTTRSHVIREYLVGSLPEDHLEQARP